MRTNSFSFVLGSEKRKKVVKTILEYPERQWSCSALEDLTKLSHATVFRTLQNLHQFGILNSTKINKKDLLFDLADSFLVRELQRILDIDKNIALELSKEFVRKVKRKNILSILLYGSAVKGTMNTNSDIDILVVLLKHNPDLEKNIQDKAAEMSLRNNKTISVVILDSKEIKEENQFTASIKRDHQLIYGKTTFFAS